MLFIRQNGVFAPKVRAAAEQDPVQHVENVEKAISKEVKSLQSAIQTLKFNGFPHPTLTEALKLIHGVHATAKKANDDAKASKDPLRHAEDVEGILANQIKALEDATKNLKLNGFPDPTLANALKMLKVCQDTAKRAIPRAQAAAMGTPNGF